MKHKVIFEETPKLKLCINWNNDNEHVQKMRKIILLTRDRLFVL